MKCQRLDGASHVTPLKKKRIVETCGGSGSCCWGCSERIERLDFGSGF